jgi:thymidylate synthase (FAD)
MVRLIAVSNPVIDECNTAEELIAFCARVSNPNNQSNHDTSDALLKYCAKNSHWSIFETVSVCLEINTTRDIGRQILRHRSFSFQEFSQRYAEVDESSFAIRECRIQDEKNRQNSIPSEDAGLEEFWDAAQKYMRDEAIEIYQLALGKGIAKEVARAILPEGMTKSVMYMNGTLRSWIHYCTLRMANGTQKEHMEIANMCWDIILAQFPSLVGINNDIK